MSTIYVPELVGIKVSMLSIFASTGVLGPVISTTVCLSRVQAGEVTGGSTSLCAGMCGRVGERGCGHE